MCWIVYALPICIFMSFFTLRALGFEPVKFMNYTIEDYYRHRDKSLHIVLSRANYCLNIFYIIIGAVVGLILGAFLYKGYIKVLTGIGMGSVIVGTTLAIVGVFVVIEKCLKKL